ncbi:MAG: hypothetical protein KBG28_23520 [Kofleriaceae bacterium]|jgi:hypothetical protein|nr:hypothetical protein [Kofleriaceae bacterium]
MNLGKGRNKISLSMSGRRFRLGVSHGGPASSWIAPAKDREAERKPPRPKR